MATLTFSETYSSEFTMHNCINITNYIHITQNLTFHNKIPHTNFCGVVESKWRRIPTHISTNNIKTIATELRKHDESRSQKSESGIVRFLNFVIRIWRSGGGHTRKLISLKWRGECISSRHFARFICVIRIVLMDEFYSREP